MTMAELAKITMKANIKALVVCLVVVILVVMYSYGFLPAQLSSRDSKYTMKIMRKGATDKTSSLDSFRRNILTQNLADVDLDKLTKYQLFLTLHAYLDNINTICQSKLRMGNLGVGGWEICDDPDVRPAPPCLVYSYSNTKDSSFEIDIARVYGCEVFVFNPKIKQPSQNQSSLIKYQKMGIAKEIDAQSGKKSVYTHTIFRKQLGHDRVPVDIIRMDVETSEWAALADMIANDELEEVKQLLVEFHIPKKESSLLPRLKVVQSLETLGFKRFYTHKNRNCKLKDLRLPVRRTACYEVHYIKR